MEAGGDKVRCLPLDDRPFRKGYQGLQEGRTHFTYYPGMAHLPSTAAPPLTMSSYSITIPIFRLSHEEEGVLIAHGNHSSGYTLYIKDHYLMYEYNSVGKVYKLRSSIEVPIGFSTICFEFTRKLFSGGMVAYIWTITSRNRRDGKDLTLCYFRGRT